MSEPFEQQLETALRARFTLLVVVTQEEERALVAIRNVAEKMRKLGFIWDLADQFQPLCGNGSIPGARDPLSALDAIDRTAEEPVFVLRDFHECWANAQIKRKLRTLAQRLKFTRKSIIVTAPTFKVPDELRDEAVRLDFDLPRTDELEAVLEKLCKVPGVQVNLTPGGRERLISAAVGLTVAQAQRVFAKAIVKGGTLGDDDIELVTHEKKEVIRESGALEYYDAHETPADVGGLEVLKDWLRLRERAFSHEARQYGLPAPKGIALIGIPGTGKSLTAKMIAALWKLPLLRLDVGALYGSLIGESEERARRALHLAQTVAPCILWIDEIEKALGTGDLDGGTSLRVLGTILTWMQEKRAPVFLVATANDVERLPPELLRKGRFDEVFFLDLPTLAERTEILAVHLRKRGRDPAKYEVAAIAQAAEGYVGSELEQAVIEAMYLGFNAGREFTTADILASLKRLVPLSISARERVFALRQWLQEGRAQSASFVEKTEAARNFVAVQGGSAP